MIIKGMRYDECDSDFITNCRPRDVGRHREVTISTIARRHSESAHYKKHRETEHGSHSKNKIFRNTTRVLTTGHFRQRAS